MPTSTPTPSTPPTSNPPRAVLFPSSDSDCCSSALSWALDNLARPGDVFHLARVQEKCRASPSPPSSSSPSPKAGPLPSNSFCPIDPFAAHAELHSSRAMIKRRFVPLLEKAEIPYEIHLLDPAEAGTTADRGSRNEQVGEALRSLAASLRASLVVVGGGLKGSGVSKRGGSSCGCSVTKYCLDRSPATVCVVRGGGGGR